jgi:ribulose-5-phosphate 4-epimerase/fuculose-1-phosphate aldolase
MFAVHFSPEIGKGDCRMQMTLQEQVTQACRILALAGQGDTLLGHVSARVANEKTFLMKATGYGLEEVTTSRLLRMNLEGTILAGQLRRHSEWPIHAEILRERADVNAIVHTHATYAMVFSMISCPLYPLSYEGALFFPDEIIRFERTADLITTPELGHEVAQRLGRRKALLLRNHGLITVGATIEEACVLALHLERACQMQLLAMQVGMSYTYLSEQEADKKRVAYKEGRLAEAVWAYYCRKITSVRDKKFREFGFNM